MSLTFCKSFELEGHIFLITLLQQGVLLCGHATDMVFVASAGVSFYHSLEIITNSFAH